MNAMCRLFLCVAVVIGCVAAQAEEKPNPARREYDEWIKQFNWDGYKNDSPLPKLSVTATEGDEPQPNGNVGWPQGIRYGCEVTADGKSYGFYFNALGTKGSGPTTLPDADLKRLDQLLSKLPDDGARLPPPGRRVVLQVPRGRDCLARVYDRGNAPDEIWEILRISRSGIRSWVPEFKSERDVKVDTYCGMIAVPPNGVAIMECSFKFRDLVTHKELKELPLFQGGNPQGITFSPNGSLAVAIPYRGVGFHWSVWDTKTRKVVRDFQEPLVGQHYGTLRFPQFTADGRFLLFLCSPPGSNDDTAILPRVYDTKTWEKRNRLPGFPGNVLTCIEAPKGKRTVILLKGNVTALWDSEGHREYAKLDEDVQIRQVAFSPDASMVAMATLHKQGDKYWTIYRIRVWKTATGELVHQLRPFEQDTCEDVVGLQWTADSQHILAATKADSFVSDYDINIWDVKSGRHRGNLVYGLSPPWGVVIVPDGSRVVASGADYKLDKDSQLRGSKVVRFWDLAAALKQIQAFEDSLAVPKAGK